MRGWCAKTADEAEMALFQLNGDVWIAKCQVHAGGRGKAGGVKLVHNTEEARALRINGLDNILVTSKPIKKANPLIAFILKKPARLIKNST